MIMFAILEQAVLVWLNQLVVISTFHKALAIAGYHRNIYHKTYLI